MYTLCDKLVVFSTLHAATPLSFLQECQLDAQQLSDLSSNSLLDSHSVACCDAKLLFLTVQVWSGEIYYSCGSR